MQRWILGSFTVAVLSLVDAATATASDPFDIHAQGIGFGAGYGGYTAGFGYAGQRSFYPGFGYGGGFGGGGFGGGGFGGGHYHYHPGRFQRHGNHFHWVPGHYDFHAPGHHRNHRHW
ncbi:MAG: hypothetical protein SFU86_10625 [Pirellulaceae bacterium]|nr:hypothetical protein [Pirellulaceae bacterium]